MKAKIQVVEQEGFIKAYIICFENGLTLRTKDCLWLTKEERNNLEQQFYEIIEKLNGVEIE